MGGKKGQISLEYLIITGFVVLAILVPTFLILFSSTNKSVYGTVNTQKAIDLGKGVINDAKQMYYLGLYSKKVVEYEVPQNVKHMFILELEHEDPVTNDITIYYYFGLIMLETDGDKLYTFQSDIPLTSDDSNNYVVIGPNGAVVNECSNPENDCEFYSFIEYAKMPGLKRFKVETIYDSNDVMVKSELIPVI